MNLYMMTMYNYVDVVHKSIHGAMADHYMNLRHYRVIPMVQLRSRIFRQTIQKFAGCSSATGKDFCEV